MKFIKSDKGIMLVLFLVTVVVYFITSPGETPYNYFARLADSLSQGKLYLLENPPWLNELIPIGNKYFVVYPPMPAIVLVPFTLILGSNLPQTTFTIVLGGANVALLYFFLKRMKVSTKTSLLISIFFSFGTNHWYLASNGSSWFMAHIVAVFFLLLALLETFGKQRLILIGLLLGASFWARTPVIFTASFFYIFLWKKFLPLNSKNLLNLIELSLGLLIFIFLDAYYNFIRFGSFTPLAPYSLIPNLDKDPIFSQGFMSIAFIPRHLEALFLKLPIIKGEPPFIIPSLYSTAIWLTSPLLIFIFKTKNNLVTLSCWVAILLTFLIISLWAGVGYAQFGYRFAQDFMPFLLILAALGIGQKPSKFAYFLLFLSLFVNTWGVIMINLFNIWSL